MDCREGCGRGEGLRRRLDREGGRASDAGFFAGNFGVELDAEFPYVLVTVDFGVPFDSFLEFPLDGWISGFPGVVFAPLMDFLVLRFGP